MKKAELELKLQKAAEEICFLNIADDFNMMIANDLRRKNTRLKFIIAGLCIGFIL